MLRHARVAFLLVLGTIPACTGHEAPVAPQSQQSQVAIMPTAQDDNVHTQVTRVENWIGSGGTVDYTVTKRTSYDNQGNPLIEDEVGFSFYITHHYATRTAYNKFGNMIEQVIETDDGYGVITQRHVFTTLASDFHGNPTEQLLESFSGDGSVNQRMNRTWEYNAQNRPIRGEELWDVMADGTVDVRYSLTHDYDQRGNRVLEKTEGTYYSEPVLLVIESSYNAHDALIGQRIDFLQGDYHEITTLVTTEFAKGGDPAAGTTQHDMGGLIYMTEAWTKVYDARNRPLSETWSINHGGELRNYTVSYRYDGPGRGPNGAQPSRRPLAGAAPSVRPMPRLAPRPSGSALDL